MYACSCLFFPGVSGLQMDNRVDSVEVKVKRLDAELIKYKDQMSRMREGPAKVQSDMENRVHVVGLISHDDGFALLFIYSSPLLERCQAESPASASTKENVSIRRVRCMISHPSKVRRAARSNGPAILQHGTSSVHYGEPQEHARHCGRHEARRQRDEATVQEDQH